MQSSGGMGASDDAVKEVVERAREYSDLRIAAIDQRLDDMDKANAVLHETVTRTPTDIQREVGHLREVVVGQLSSVAAQFEERDERVLVALQAQKDLINQRDEANQRAISKADESMAKTVASLGSKIDDMRDRIGVVESVIRERPAQRAQQEVVIAEMRRQLTELAERVSKI